MNKKIEDYLPYYIGQDCMTGDYKGKIQSVGSEEIDFMCVVSGTNQDEESGFYGEDEENDVKPEMVKPILRPLSDMTREEREIFGWQEDWIFEDKSDPNQPMKTTFLVWEFIDLLKMGFDLFGLIEANLAVDKTKEVNHATN